MSINLNQSFWRNKKVFLTGHTGFKGSWLSLMLQDLGSTLKGFSLPPPTTTSMFNIAKIGDDMFSELGDIRNFSELKTSLISFNPDIIIHMAAQPLVRLSYEKPIETYSTNIMGTVNLFEAARSCDNLKVIINVTSDKCYENNELGLGYKENDRLGGHDPYSSSKACSELITKSYKDAFFKKENIFIASARAGNVIGGGDWAKDRLIPDILRAIEKGKNVHLRNPSAVRPWQHVLEPIYGYLLLAEKLFNHHEHYSEPWNFGPEDNQMVSVKTIIELISKHLKKEINWEYDHEIKFIETNVLKLDISKTVSRLNWLPKLSIDKSIQMVVDWHSSYLIKSDMKIKTLNQIKEYFDA